jgi:hypothetical protein
MRLSRLSLILACLAGGIYATVGCHTSSSETPLPTTMPAPETNMKTPGPTTMPVPSAAAPPAKDMTHALTKDEPYFTVEPGGTSTPTPAGTLKAGSKVLVIIPGAPYSQVVTDTGISAYTMTEGLKPLGK